MLTKDDCVICGMVATTEKVPIDHRLLTAFAMGRVASRHTSKDPPFCGEHEVLSAALTAMVEAVVKQNPDTEHKSEEQKKEHGT